MNYASRLHQRLGFAAMIFHAPETDGKTGSSKPATLEDKLAAAEKARDEHKASLDLVTKERDDLKSERDNIQNQFNALTTAANKSKDDLKISQDAVTSLTKERDDLKEKSTKDATNITRLESLCGVKGVDHNSAVPTVPASGAPGHVYDQWVAANGAEKTRLFRAHRLEIRAEAQRRAANQ